MSPTLLGEFIFVFEVTTLYAFEVTTQNYRFHNDGVYIGLVIGLLLVIGLYIRSQLKKECLLHDFD